MISVLAEERLLSATLGAVFAGVVVFEQRKSIYRTEEEFVRSRYISRWYRCSAVLMYLMHPWRRACRIMSSPMSMTLSLLCKLEITNNHGSKSMINMRIFSVMTHLFSV